MQYTSIVEELFSALTAFVGREDSLRSTEAVADLLVACRGKVLVTGVGTSHGTALRFSHLLTCCGVPGMFVDSSDARHGGAGLFASGDVLVAVSKGGESAEVNEVSAIARERGSRVVAVTERAQSTLGCRADVVLVLPPLSSLDPYGMIAIGSSLVISGVLDLVLYGVLQRVPVNLEEFARIHPGGAVGLRLRSGEEGAD